VTTPIPQAAVVGGSVVSFAAGLPQSHREDVYLSTMFAQRATRDAYHNGLSGDWFDYYCNQLRFIGWDVPRPLVLAPISDEFMAASASRQIANQLGEDFHDPSSQALAALRRDTRALDLFESTSLSREAGIFQVIPCRPKGAHRVELGIYHCQFRLRLQTSRFLFIEREDLVLEKVEKVAFITFNTLYYATYREKIRRSMLAQSLTFLKGLEL
jgi:hypothetical protein